MSLCLPKKNSKHGLTVEESLVKTTPDAHLILDSFFFFASGAPVKSPTP